MFDFLVKSFIKNYEDIRNAKVREHYGRLTGIVGIIINLFLFTTKFIIGSLVNSVSITGDAINNLSDAGSSIISLISFKLSNKPADYDHPFGHARLEYIASSVVATFILLLGFELLKTSYGKIINPVEIKFSSIAIAILIVSILAKLWLYLFNKKLGKRIDSTIMFATAADSLSDVMATSAVLASAIISPLIGFQLDGYMGVAVALFIMSTAVKILKSTINSILGQGPTKELIELIDNYIREYDGIIGMHDLVVHDYGPNRCFASVHAEVDSNVDILESHDLIDRIERDILSDFGIHLVIHMDPIVTDDPYVNMLCQMTKELVMQIDNCLTIHDFRVVKGTTHNNLIFDVLVPYECKKSDNKIIEDIISGVYEINENLYAVITIDRSYVTSPPQPNK